MMIKVVMMRKMNYERDADDDDRYRLLSTLTNCTMGKEY